jgi:hypothetical protein
LRYGDKQDRLGNVAEESHPVSAAAVFGELGHER